MSARHGNVEDVYPLSPLQEGLLFHSLAAGEPGMYVTQVSGVLAGRLDVAAFDRAWQTVARRHPALRTAFAWKSAEAPVQIVGREVRIPIEVLDWRAIGTAERDRLWRERLAADRARGLDPARAPLLRLLLAKEDEARHRLLWTHHHLLLDGWSVAIVLAEAFAAYRAALAGGEPELPAAAPFRAYVAWLKRRDAAAAEPAWRRALAGFTAPTRLPAGGVPEPTATGGSERATRLATAVADALGGRLRGWRITPGTAVAAAWAQLLGRHADEDDVVFGFTVSGRPAELSGVEGMVGLFINTLPLRVDLRPERSIQAALAELQERVVLLRQFEHVPLVAIQGWSEVPRGQPLFESFVAFESYPAAGGPDGAADGRPAELEFLDVRASEQTNYPLGLAASPEFSLRITYDPRRFEAVAVERLLAHLGNLLAALATERSGAEPIGDLPLLSAAERAALLVEWNDSAAPLPRATVPALFAGRAALAPDAIALTSDASWLSYGELARRAAGVAAHLRGRGLVPGQVVAVASVRNPDLVAALLGVLAAGGVFLPLDPSHPAERRDWISADAGAVAVLTGGEGAGDRAGEQGEARPAIEPGAIVIEPDAPAYLIYTSGTTGRPKGVLVEHGSLVATLAGTAATFGFSSRDRMPVVAPAPFDIFLFELLSPLLVGGVAELVPLAPALDVARLVDRLTGMTRFHAVPALMRQVVDRARHCAPAESFAGLRTLFVGGDAVPKGLLVDLGEVFPAAEVRVLYGPTEAAILATSHAVRDGGFEAPIGRPLPNVRIDLRDRHGRPVPIGAPGEIWIGGPGVARGYRGRDELTAERFPTVDGRRWYRTGDRARRRFDGALEFLGRGDQQVKIRGVRIEPAEVEAVLAALPGVAQAAVVARRDAGGDLALSGVVVAEPTAALAPAALRARLRELLPEVMVPSEIALLDALPLTPHGKVDRAALARRPVAASGSAIGGASGGASGRLPRGAAEELVAALFAEVLGRERVAADDDFFALGGHSLLATRVVARLRARVGLEVPLGELFTAPTVAAFAARLEAAETGARASRPPLARAPRGELPPLSFGQERFWFLNRLDPESAAYLLPVALGLSGPLSVPAWRAALARVVERHEVLRTTFPEIDGAPRQRLIGEPVLGVPLFDLARLPPARRAAELARLAAAETRRPFDVERQILLRAALARLDAEEHAALFSLHHLVSDGWSIGVLVRELVVAYRARIDGRRDDLPELPIQVGDHAAWQRAWLTGPVYDALVADWTARLAGAPEILALPTDRPRPPVQSFRGGARPFALGADLSRGLFALARRQGATPFLVLLSAFFALLRRLSGQDDLCIATPVAGRTQIETEPLIGLFLNTLVLRQGLDGRQRFERLLAAVRQTAFAAFARQDLPFERLVAELRPERSLGYNPLFQAMLAYQNVPREELDLPGLAVRSIALEATATQLDLELVAVETDGELEGALRFATDLFDPSTAERFVAQLATLLAAAVAAPERELGELPALAPAERHQLAFEWSGEGTIANPVPGGPCDLYERLDEHAERQPTALAAVCAGERATYAELRARVDALRTVLVAAGAGPDRLVAILAERGLDLLTAVVATLAAGAAYLPLDRSWPPARIAALLDRARPRLVLVDAASSDLLARASAERGGGDAWPTVAIASARPAASGESAASSPPAPHNALAYVLFTSGSTGEPKGAMVERRGMLNHLAAKVRELDLGPRDRVAQTASHCFDISVWQMLAPLVAGGSVEIVPDEVARDPARLLDAVERSGVTVWQMVPSLLRYVVAEAEERRGRQGGERSAEQDAAAPPLAALRTLVLAGEALPPEPVRRFQALYPGVAILNGYGPTECADNVSHHMIRSPLAPSALEVSIGRPLAGVRLMVLDPELATVPIGVVGQLCAGGAAVGRGYLDDPARTAAAFLPDPSGVEPGGRIYATGDLARFEPSGRLAFLGRFDHQVKVRGFRIELGEIEAALLAHPGVAAAAAVADPAGLAAFVVLDAAGVAAGVVVGDLRARLRAVLPDYMVPGWIELLAALPLSANGKVDRRALAALPSAGGGEAASAPGSPGERSQPNTPAGAIAALLAEIVARLLKRERVLVDDHFFEIGGHSLLAIQLAAAVRRTLGVELPLRELFERPRLADLATVLERRLAGGAERIPPLARVPRDRRLPLSSAQERLFFFDRFEPGSAAYNVPSAVHLEGVLDVAALAGALTEIVRRHEILRTTYRDDDGEACQVIGPPVPVPLPVVDLSGLAREVREGASSRLSRDLGLLSFDLGRGPILRAALLRLAAEEHAAVLTVHHIAADAWSARLLVREIAILYACGRAGRPSPLPELPVQYADFAVWQRGRLADGGFEADLGEWRRRLADLPVLALPTDRPRPAASAHRGAQRAAALPMVAELRALARAHEATLFMVLLAAFSALLAERTGQDDVVVGTNVAGRSRAEVEGLIGFFLNMLALRTDLAGDPTFGELVARVRTTTIAAYCHQELPFDRLVEALRVRREPGRHPLFQVKVDYQALTETDEELPELTLRWLPPAAAAAHSDLTVYFSERADGVAAVYEFDTDLFDEATILDLAADLDLVLRLVAAAPASRLSTLRARLGEAAEHRRSERERQWQVGRRLDLRGARRRSAG